VKEPGGGGCDAGGDGDGWDGGSDGWDGGSGGLAGGRAAARHAARRCHGCMGTRGAGLSEWDAALQALNEPVSHLRTEALDMLSALLTQQGWSLAPAKTAASLVAAL